MFKGSIQKFIVPVGIVTGWFMAPLGAQEATDEAKKNSVSISLVAVGDLPAIQYEATGKGPVFIEPPAKEFPPPFVYVQNKAKKEGFDQLNLGLNTPMAPIHHPGGRTMRLFQDQADALATEDGTKPKESYLSVPLPDEKVDLTVFLLRNPKTKSWRTTPRSYAFKNDLLSFPPNCVRVINFSAYRIKARISGLEFDLGGATDSAPSKVMPAQANENVLIYQMVGEGNGTPVLLANTATSFFQGSRLNMVVYDGDGADSSGTMKFCMFQEAPVQKSPEKAVPSAAPANP